MKVFKRNAVIVTVLIFVCVAVYLNWSYAQTEVSANAGKNNTHQTEDNANKDTNDSTAKDAKTSGLYFVESSEDGNSIKTGVSTETSEYFAQVRLSRQQARDSAQTTLQTVSNTEGTNQETIDEAMSTMVNIAKWTEEEARLESLIIAKGFQDCVAYMTDQGITITVSADADGLSSSAVARIKDIVLAETAYTADQLKIIEIK